jgi:murein DD-endopeptidase MepM/ murein hydrolase activator NlpD
VVRKVRKTFLRSPIEFARISSHFNLRRKHPVLNRIRAHKGVDYAAKSGTPIKATGAGKIVFKGRKGGYGNVVIVQHNPKHKSLYAHMSKFNRQYKVGNRVKQGAIIGYVGKTGLATGAHLHYEFLVNGVHKNPLTVKLPRLKVTAKKDKIFLAHFKQQTQPYIDQLNQATMETAAIKVEKLFSKKIRSL